MDQYEIFKKNINELIGIDLNLYKEKQMLRRITSLMRRNGFSDFIEYYNKLKVDKELLDQFVNYLTINVSEFFRNISQWKVLEEDILPNLIKSANKKSLSVWSSACSTGEEAYSLAMLFTKFYNLDKIKILATDIDVSALNKAREGVYDEKALKNVPKEFVVKFFKKIKTNIESKMK